MSGTESTRIEVRKPGLSTTIQDGGRVGYYHLGIPPSGALDQYSLAAANALVGNAPDAAALEIVYMGPELVFTGPAVVAVAGAQMTPRVNGSDRPNWESFSVAEGDVLDFDYLKAGARAYLAARSNHRPTMTKHILSHVTSLDGLARRALLFLL